MTKRKTFPLTINVPVSTLAALADDGIEYVEDDWSEEAFNLALKKAKMTRAQLKTQLAADPKLVTMVKEYIEDYVEWQLLESITENGDMAAFGAITKLYKMCDTAYDEIEAERVAEDKKLREKEEAETLAKAVDVDVIKELADVLKKKGLKIVKA